MSEREPADDAGPEEPTDAPGWRSWAEEPDGDATTASVGVATEGDPAAFRAAYGPLRGPLKRRSRRFTSLAGWLAQANIEQTPDQYLSRAVRRSLAAALLTVVALAALVVGLGSVGGAFGVVETVTSSLLRTVVAVGVLGAAAFLATAAGHYYYPLVRATWRRRNIDVDLPHAVVFMYALAEAGLDLPEIVRRLAAAEETYGTVATEFEGVVVDIDRFNLDTLTALDEARRHTPSADLAEFLDDLGNVIESGGHLDSFLEKRSESQLQAARQQQEQLVQTVAAVVESYITLVFAGPIFLMTVLVTLGFVGINTLPLVMLTTYLLLPVGIASFVLFFHVYNQPRRRSIRVTVDETDSGTTASSTVESYNRAKRRNSFREVLDQPLVSIQQRPLLSLVVTVPVACALCLAVIATDVATPTASAYTGDPIWTTTALVVVPGLVPSVGLMLAHESEQRRLRDVRRRLPDVLGGMSNASRNGLAFGETISLAAQRSEGALATHLQRLDNDIRVTGDLQRSLRRFAAEVGVNRLTRVVTVLSEGNRATERLDRVLGIVAEDTQERSRLDVRWRQAMQPYVAFFVIGVLVYLFIILVFVEVFFPILDEVSGEALGGPAALGQAGGQLPVQAFEATLYHSLLIQAVGNGLAMGKLIENSLAGGLKYVNPLLVVMVVVFYVV